MSETTALARNLGWDEAADLPIARRTKDEYSRNVGIRSLEKLKTMLLNCDEISALAGQVSMPAA